MKQKLFSFFFALALLLPANLFATAFNMTWNQIYGISNFGTDGTRYLDSYTFMNGNNVVRLYIWNRRAQGARYYTTTQSDGVSGNFIMPDKGNYSTANSLGSSDIFTGYQALVNSTDRTTFVSTGGGASGNYFLKRGLNSSVISIAEGADGPYIRITGNNRFTTTGSNSYSHTVTIGSAATYRTVTVNRNDNSMGSVSYVMKSGYVYTNNITNWKNGSTWTLTATPNTGYHFVCWKKGNTQISTNETTDVIIDGNATYTAYFEQDASTKYTITTNVNTAGWGTVTPGGEKSENSNFTITATPASLAYGFVKWQKNGADFSGNTVNPITVPVTADATYTAVFEHLPQGVITVVSNYGTVTGAGSYERGTQVTLTVTPNSGYTFAQWSDNNTDNPRYITVTGDATYTAQYYDLNQPLLASFSWDDDNIGVESYGDGDNLCNSFYSPAGKPFKLLYAKSNSRNSKNYLQLSIQSSQSQMWGEVSWAKTGSYPVLSSGLTTGSCGYSTYWYWTLSQTNVCVAYGYDSYDLGLNILGSYLCDKSGNADDTSDQSNYISVTEGMTCVIEEGAGGNPYIRLVRNSDQQCMVSVGEAKPKYNVSITAPENGTITVSYNDGSAQSFTSGSRSIEEGTELTVTTTPAADYHFGAWTGNGAASVTVDGAKTIGATFAQNDYFLNATYGTGGASVTRGDDGNSSTVKPAGNTVTLSATAENGYEFLAWAGDDAEKISNNVFTFLTNGTHNTTYNVQATFQAITYNISYEGLEGATNTNNPTSYTIETATITLANPGTRTGYTFANWTDDDNSAAVVTGIAKGSTGDRNFTATWTANSYDITYKDKDNADYSGSNLASLPATHTYNTPTNLVAGVKSGYNFLGWYDNAACDGDAIETIGATAKTANFTLYAKWELAATYSSVTFTAGEHGSVSGAIGGVAINSGDNQVDGSTITLTATPDNFYSFVEWRNASNQQVSTSAVYEFTLSEAVSLTAIFEQQEIIELTDGFEDGSQWQIDYANLLTLLRENGTNGQSEPRDVRIIRTFKAGRWSTFSLPFNYSFQNPDNNTFRDQVYYLISAEYKEGGYLTLNCMPNTYRIEANKPYILIPDADIVNPVFENVKLTEIVDNSYSASDKNGSGSVIFRNTQYRQIIYNEESSINKRTIYLSNNRLYYPGTTDMYMNAFRGYFYMDYENIFHSPARIRLMNDMGEQIETLPEGEEETSAEVKKYIENGILVIERGGVKYDAQGHKLN